MSTAAEDFTFRFVGSFVVDKLQSYISEHPEIWELDTSRQNSKDSAPHSKTQSLIIHTYSKEAMQGRTDLGPYIGGEINPAAGPDLARIIAPYVAALEEFHQGRVGRTILVRLPAGADVYAHQDSGIYMAAVRRSHVVVTTNEGVIFTTGDEAKQMKVGECWEVNNGKLHSIVNNGTTHRDHLMIDILPDKLF